MPSRSGLENCVTYFRLALERPDGTIRPVKLNLKRIYLEKRDRWPLKYDPSQFGSANIRVECRVLGLKNVAALIFSTGKVVCPGPSSPRSGLIMAHLITAEVSRMLGAPFAMRNFQLPNLVGKINAPPVDIRMMADMLGDAKARYEPAGTHPFPACFVFPHRDADEPDKVVYLVFDSGKVVITGCRSEEDVDKNAKEARDLCALFPKRGSPSEGLRTKRLREADRAAIGAIDIGHPVEQLRLEGPAASFSAGVRYTPE